MVDNPYENTCRSLEEIKLSNSLCSCTINLTGLNTFGTEVIHSINTAYNKAE